MNRKEGHMSMVTEGLQTGMGTSGDDHVRTVL